MPRNPMPNVTPHPVAKQPTLPIAMGEPVAQVYPDPAGAASSSGPMAQLRELKELLDNGTLTQEEFDAQKKKALGDITVHDF